MRKHITALSIYLSLRIILMILLQGIMYGVVMRTSLPVAASSYYWPVHLTLINGGLLVLMLVIFRKNGVQYFKLITQFNKQDTRYFLLLLMPIIVTAMLPNVILSLLFYQDPFIGSEFLLGELPLVFMIMNLSLFPILQGLVELPYYFLFIMPRLKNINPRKCWFIGLPVFFLSIQHAFMPFRFDLVYLLYRSLMFLPFALLIGFLIHKRPSLVSYLVVLHILMNASLFLMYFI